MRLYLPKLCCMAIFISHLYMSRVMRKPDFCTCENKDADQLRGNREADQRLCFRYTDSKIPLLPKYEISSLQPSSVVVQPGLCRALSETPKTGFLTTRLIYFHYFLRKCLFYLSKSDKSNDLGFVTSNTQFSLDIRPSLLSALRKRRPL